MEIILLEPLLLYTYFSAWISHHMLQLSILKKKFFLNFNMFSNTKLLNVRIGSLSWKKGVEKKTGCKERKEAEVVA